MNDGQILAGSTELAQIALKPDRQHDGFGVDRSAACEGQREGAALTRNRGHPGAVTNIYGILGELLVPGAQNLLAGPPAILFASAISSRESEPR